MLNVDLLSDEIFGCEPDDDECIVCLKMLSAALEPLTAVQAVVFDGDRRRLAAWSKQNVELSELRVTDGAVAALIGSGEPLWITESQAARWTVTVAFNAEKIPCGFLMVEFQASDAAVDSERHVKEQVGWLRALGAAMLALNSRTAVAIESEARMKQMEQQHRAFQEEHFRIVETNLEESDGRIQEQRRYAMQLEKEVEKRTRDLMASEAEIRVILDTAPDGIITFDRNGLIQSCNRVASKMFGYEDDQVIGLHASMLLGKAVMWVVGDANQKKPASSRVKCVDHEFMARRLDGQQFPVHFAVSSALMESGPMYTVIMRDVSDLKETEQLIRLQTERLTAMNKAKSEFLANMSHEIRTPMTAILGYAEILRSGNAHSEQTEAIDTILRNGNFLLEIINDILDLSKIESGKIEVENIEVAPVQIVQDVADLMKVRAAPKNLSLDVEFRGPIPDTIHSDPTRLRQILVNLTGNAIKFTENGGVKIIAELLVADPQQPELQFEIVDTGIGIRPDLIDKLFHPFAQADSSTTRKFGGSGLGLAICHRLTEMLGGTIEVESSPGSGSTFRFTVATGDLTGIRLRENPDVTIAAAPSTTEREKRLKTDVQRRILLAEDGPDNQRLIKFILQKAGLDVTVVDNGEIALNSALEAERAGEPFDVILMDMQMPVMDGYTATGKLREADYRRPIIALTAHAMKSDRGKCLDAGCDEYTTKPIKREELLSLIAELSAANDE